jgi:hypothetical protein
VPVSTKKIDGKGTIGRPRLRWEDNIRIHLKEMGWKGIDWIDLAQDRDM